MTEKFRKNTLDIAMWVGAGAVIGYASIYGLAELYEGFLNSVVELDKNSPQEVKNFQEIKDFACAAGTVMGGTFAGILETTYKIMKPG